MRAVRPESHFKHGKLHILKGLKGRLNISFSRKGQVARGEVHSEVESMISQKNNRFHLI